MEKVFASPSRYVQGKGVLKSGLDHILALGKRALLLADSTVYEIAGRQLEEDLKARSAFVHYEAFHGEASDVEIDRVSQVGRDLDIQVILGLGGGKTIDTAKAIADKLQVQVAILPTKPLPVPAKPPSLKMAYKRLLQPMPRSWRQP